MAEANVTHQLPPEVLAKIFEHCGVNELVNIVDVCQLWRDVAIHQYTTSENDLVIRRPDDINDLISLLCKPVSFTKLHIVWDIPRGVYCSSVSLDALADVTSLNHLQSFTFKAKAFVGVHPNSSYVLAALLTLIRQTSTDTLTHFKLVNTGPDLSRKVVEVLEACQHLTHLVLNGCGQYPEDYRRCVDIIPTLTHLELLDLRGTYLLAGTYLSFIADVRRGCPNISNNIMVDYSELRVRPSDDMRMLQFVSHVDTLDIEQFDTEQLRSLISSLNECASQLSVDEVYVSWCKDHLTDDILLSLVQRLRGVKEVNAHWCHHLTNEGVVNVITSSPQLKEIFIPGIKNITTDIIQLLDRVVTVKNVHIYAHDTKLSEQMENNPDRQLYTGKNGIICLQYRY